MQEPEEKLDYMGWRGFITYVLAIIIGATCWGYVLGKLFHK